MSSTYVLYDLPSKDPCKCWSLNPWKTRMLFNYKTISYETQWVEYPDIKPMFEKHVPPNPEGAFAPYTIPTVRFPDGSYMQDSRQIADRIEKDHPNPPVRLYSDTLKDLEAHMSQIVFALFPDFANKVPQRILRDASLPFWYKSREGRLGMKLDQVEKEKGGEKAYQAAAPTLQKVTKQLQASADGPFFEGDQVTYADFVWAGFLQFMKNIGEEVFGRLLELSGDADVHLAQLKACGPWMERDDH